MHKASIIKNIVSVICIKGICKFIIYITIVNGIFFYPDIICFLSVGTIINTSSNNNNGIKPFYLLPMLSDEYVTVKFVLADFSSCKIFSPVWI